MARTTVKCLFSIAWTTMIVAGAAAGILFVAVGSVLDRTEHWVDTQLD